MKAAIAAGVFVFLFLFLATTFVPSPAAEAQARAYGFTSRQIDDGMLYSLERKLIYWTRTGATFGLLAVAVFSGWGRTLAYGCSRLTGCRWFFTVLLVGLTCFLIEEIINFLCGWVGLEVQRSWGMTQRSFLSWTLEFLKSIGVQAVIGAVVLIGFYGLVKLFPRRWWLPAAAGSSLLGVVFALALPVLIEPLFNTFRPLSDPQALPAAVASTTALAATPLGYGPLAGTEELVSGVRDWQLRERLLALAERAGVPVREVLVMDASRQGNHTNAYFSGFGPTRRIVLYDTLIKSHPPDEIEAILAHEIGHWENHHIVKGLALASIGAFAGCFAMACLLRWAVGRRPFLLTAPYDPAGLPLVLLLLGIGTWLTMPLENAVSRHFERQADMASLDLTGRPEVFMEAERRLARDNIGNVAPSPLSVWLFASHPPAVERMQMAEQWEKRHGRPNR